jgi:hypothetical protein
MEPDWTVANLVIQAITGIIGAHVAAHIVHEHGFGFIGHSLVGLLAGAFSGYFFQRIANTVVMSTGEPMPVSAVDTAVIQTLTGAGVGGIAMLVIGLIRYEMTKPKR